MPVQKTLLAVNNFVVTTTAFLNNFSNTCEHKVARITARVTDLETLLAVFEAKLNSIPLDPATAAAAAAAADTAEAAAAPQPRIEASPPSSLSQASVQPSQPTAVPVSAPIVAGAGAPPAVQPPQPSVSGPLIKDHPDYEPFFKMLKVGLPPFVVQAKMATAGLDPTYLDRGDEPMPAGSNAAAGPVAAQQPMPVANVSSGVSVVGAALPTPSLSQPSSSAAAAPVPPPPPPAPAPSSSGGLLIKDHPDYEPFFKMLKVGLPPFVVQAKMATAGLDPTYLDRGDEPMPAAGCGNTAPAAPVAPSSSTVTSVPPPPAPAPAPTSAPAAASAPPPATPAGDAVSAPSNSVGLLIKDHPDYEPFFKMLKVGLPPFVVQAKMATAGLDPTYLDRGDEPM